MLTRQTARSGLGLAFAGLLLVDPIAHERFPAHSLSTVLLTIGVILVWILVGVGVVGSLPAAGAEVRLVEGHEGEEEDGVGAL